MWVYSLSIYLFDLQATGEYSRQFSKLSIYHCCLSLLLVCKQQKQQAKERERERGRETYICICMYMYVCTHIYIYICCEVIIWSKFGGFRGYYLVQVGVIIWSKLVFLPIFIVVSSDFWEHSVIILCFLLCPIIWQFSKNSLFQKRVQIFYFSVFSLIFENYHFLCWLKHYKKGVSAMFWFLLFKSKKKPQK